MLSFLRGTILAIVLAATGFALFIARHAPAPVSMRATAPTSEAAVPSPVAVTPQLATPLPAHPPTESLPLAPLMACLGRAGQSGACLDAIFGKFLKTHSTAEAAAILARYESGDTAFRLSCHPVVHALGRETFRKLGTVHDSFAACDQFCHSGCYHGAMERFLRGTAAGGDAAGHISLDELRTKAVGACDPKEAVRFRFQCLHGLGHALMFFSDYRLGEALTSCDAFPDTWSRSSCYGGVFMENVFSATAEKRDLKANDYHYPCSALGEQYKADCYMMQTTRMTELGLSTERLFGECRKAAPYHLTCMQSIGRDLSNDARTGDPRLVAAKCELGTGDERAACTRGVAYALIDNTWDGRYAFPFCATFKDGTDVRSCFSVSAGYLTTTFEKNFAAILADCQKYAPASSLCREFIGR